MKDETANRFPADGKARVLTRAFKALIVSTERACPKSDSRHFPCVPQSAIQSDLKNEQHSAILESRS
jgi:hypothetical protein